MKLHDTQPIHERVAILEAALAEVLDIDETMAVEPFPNSGPDLCVWVFERSCEDVRRGHDLHEIAKHLERLLA
jgi:hypothetical protein